MGFLEKCALNVRAILLTEHIFCFDSIIKFLTIRKIKDFLNFGIKFSKILV